MQSSVYIIRCLKTFDDDCNCLLGRKWLWFVFLGQMKLTVKWDLPFIRNRVRPGLSQQGSCMLVAAHWGS